MSHTQLELCAITWSFCLLLVLVLVLVRVRVLVFLLPLPPDFLPPLIDVA